MNAKNEFKTAAGTVLPILDLRGKPYLQVAHRIVWFREDHPTWLIACEFIRLDDGVCICKASIVDEEGKVRAVAHKREDQKHFPDFMEKAETGAAGRALAMLGYGTQFCADELDEEHRVVDSPITPIKKLAPIVSPTAPLDSNKMASVAQRKLISDRLEFDLGIKDLIFKSQWLKTAIGKEKTEQILASEVSHLLEVIKLESEGKDFRS